MPEIDITDIQNPNADNSAARNKAKRLELANEEIALARAVFIAIGEPLDVWAVAATLEGMGLRDDDAVKKYQRTDLFILAERILYLIHVDPTRTRPEEAPPPPPARPSHWAQALRFYFRGASAALPMAGQILSVLLLRYSLWAWVDFSETQATVVSIGTILSFLITAGFIQSIGREGTRYMGHTNYFLARKISLSIVRAGSGSVLAFGIFIYTVNLIIPFYDNRLMVISLMYYFLLSELWLFSSLAYVLNKVFTVFISTIIGMVPVYIVMEFTTLGIYVAHALGMFTTIIAIASHTLLHLRRLASKTDMFLMMSRLPHAPVRTYVVAPYFVYGLLYFVNLFLDRVVSWSAPNPEPLPYVIWFRASYELGMDWALLSLVLTLASLEYMIYEFSYQQLPKQHAVYNADVIDYLMFFKRFYVKHLFSITLVGGISIMVTYYGVIWFQRFDYIPEVKNFFSSAITYRVFWAAAFGYYFIALGLYNCLFFFTLSCPQFAIRSITVGLSINVVVSIALSRWVQYDYGVGGLTIGGIVFAILTMKYARKFFDRLDYYYYAAF